MVLFFIEFTKLVLSTVMFFGNFSFCYSYDGFFRCDFFQVVIELDEGILQREENKIFYLLNTDFMWIYVEFL